MSTESPNSRVYVWTNPDAEEGANSLIRLFADSLLLAAIPSGKLKRTVAAIRRGDSVAGKVIPLAAVIKLEGDESHEDLIVTYRTGENKLETAGLGFKDKTDREELFWVLMRGLGGPWLRSRVKAKWRPYIYLGVAVMVALGFLSLASFSASDSRPRACYALKGSGGRSLAG